MVTLGAWRHTAGTIRASLIDSPAAACLALLILTFALAGCESAPQSVATAPVAPAAPPPDPPAIAPAAAAKPTIQPASVVGLNRRDVRKLLGEPGLIRHDAPAEVWQYRTAACVLDLVLYREKNEPRVAYAEARTPAADPTPTDSCLTDIAAKRRHLSNS